MNYQHVERPRINLAWLRKLRWAAIIGQLTTILVVSRWMRIDLPLLKMLLVIGIAAASNVALGVWIRTHSHAWPQWAGQGERIFGSLLMLDNLLLTMLLYLSGGASNPFTVFYLVNIALAAALLPARWAWGLDAAAFLCFALLFFVHVSIPELEHGADHEHAMHHGTRTAPGPMSLHLQGSLLAFGGAATFIVYFITRIAGELARRDAELDEARRRKAESDKFESLATLAAGAAHELASPLSTIAVLAKDLELGRKASESLQDIQLIRSQVALCRRILDSMTVGAGECVAEEWECTTPQNFLEWVISDMAAVDRTDLDIEPRLAQRVIRIPRLALSQALRAIVQNALQAAPAPARIQLDTLQIADNWQISVTDHGPGMTEEVLQRVGEPFFTTKEPGAGMGLGLFLARRVIDRLQGTMTIKSQVATRTTVNVTLPLTATSTDAGRLEASGPTKLTDLRHVTATVATSEESTDA